MYQEIINSYFVQVEKLITPFEAFTRLSFSNSEKMYALQQEIIQSYVALGVEQMKALTEIKDPESLQAFVAKQVDVAKSVSEKLIADAQAVAEIGSEFNTETQKLAQESLSAVVSQAA